MARAPRPAALERLLVPEPERVPGEGFRELVSTLARGLPARLPLEDGLELLLAVPSGLARRWTELDPTLLVAGGDLTGRGFLGDRPAPLPARLLLRAGGGLLASAPLVAGARLRLPDAAPRVELRVLDWRLCAGTLRGAGDVGSRLRLVWRPVGGAQSPFEAPAVHPAVVAREEDRR